MKKFRPYLLGCAFAVDTWPNTVITRASDIAIIPAALVRILGRYFSEIADKW
jgi:hypothetical protein